MALHPLVGVYCDIDIERLGENGYIAPYNSHQLQPASYDVRLGTTFRVFTRNHAIKFIDPGDQTTLERLTEKITREPGSEVLIHPGEFMLGCTAERFSIPDEAVGRIEGKSTIGRLGLAIHVTAGYLDPGFKGVITLEMANLAPLPIVLRPGMLIAQVSYHALTKTARKPYQGKYQNDMEAVPSRYGTARIRNI